MLRHFAILIPCFVCICWTIILILRPQKSVSQKMLSHISLLAAVYFFADSCHFTPSPDYGKLVFLDVIADFCTLVILPCIVLYFDALTGRIRPASYRTAVILPAFFMLATEIIIFATMGAADSASYLEAFAEAGGHPEGYTDRIYYLYDTFSLGFYSILIMIWLVYSLFSLIRYLVRNDFDFGDLFGFVFKGRRSSPINISVCAFILVFMISSVQVSLGRQWQVDHIVVFCIFCFVIGVIAFFIFYLGTFYEGSKIGLADLNSPSGTGRQKDVYQNIMTREEFSEVVKRGGASDLADRFEAYMTEEKAYLDPDLSMEKVARALHTNRTYVSVMMREKFGTGFREYISARRLEAARDMLLKSPDVSLSAVAASCGYSSDSQLVKKFQEAFGLPPKAWVRNELAK